MGRLAALAKGEVAEAKASNPVRFCAGVVGVAVAVVVVVVVEVAVEPPRLLKGEGDLLPDAKDDAVPALPQGDVEGCLPPKMRGPATFANGELVDAYAAKPP